VSLEPRNVAVNDTLNVPLVVNNPAGLPLTFSWRGPELPGLDRTVVLTGTPNGGELSYTPLASHVGTLELVVAIGSSLGASEQTLRVTVVPAASAAPVFLRPGAGATFDLTSMSCVGVDLEVRDDDSTAVEIRAASGMPLGAELTATNPKSAHFEWCPSPDQINASDRWPVVFEADDGVHTPTQHEFLVILRNNAKEGCPGTPPEVAIQSPSKGQKLTSLQGYDVRFTVSDDQGLRDAPVLFWTIEEPGNLEAPDLSVFEPVVALEEGSGFVARVPSLGLKPGEERVVYAVASATDNDDPNGTACDHTTDSATLRFIAVGISGQATAPECAACEFSSDCASGLCVSTPSGGVCLGKCGVDCPSAATCATVTSVEGSVPQACADLAEACGGGGGVSCSPDDYEPNDTVQEASKVQLGLLEGEICPSDVDFFELEVPADTRLTFVLQPSSADGGDLDLQLRAADGTILTVSASEGSEEEVSLCVNVQGSFVAEVFGYSGQTGAYSLQASAESEGCCTDDNGEDDDATTSARPLAPGIEQGVICPFDDDYFKFVLDTAGKVSLTLAGGEDDVDVDLQVYGPSGAIVASGETFGDEFVSWTASPGVHFVRVFGWQGSTGPYLIELDVAGLSGCSSDFACPSGTVCFGAEGCGDAFCSSSSQCPNNYICPFPGPVEDVSLCGAPCTSNTQCRADEACKYFYEGRYCGVRGNGQNGAPCEAFFDCGGQRSCVPWPGGYCARDNCSTSNDCEGGTHCVPIDGVGACVVDCWSSDSICRLGEGYACDALPDIDGDTQLVCVPESL
jgi:hypothetical protein